MVGLVSHWPAQRQGILIDSPQRLYAVWEGVIAQGTLRHYSPNEVAGMLGGQNSRRPYTWKWVPQCLWSSILFGCTSPGFCFLNKRSTSELHRTALGGIYLDSGARLLGFEAQCCHFLVMCAWNCYLFGSWFSLQRNADNKSIFIIVLL